MDRREVDIPDICSSSIINNTLFTIRPPRVLKYVPPPIKRSRIDNFAWNSLYHFLRILVSSMLADFNIKIKSIHVT